MNAVGTLEHLAGVHIVLPERPGDRFAEIASALRGARVLQVEFYYFAADQGAGGYRLWFFNSEDQGEPHDQERVDADIQQQLAESFSRLVSERFSNWRNKPGSFGSVTWDVRANRIRHHPHQRTINIESSLIDGL